MTDSLSDKQQRLNAEALKLTCSELAQRFARYVLGDHITFTPIERILLQDALDSYARRPSSAPSVAIERVKAWFYSKPRKQAQAAFTAGDERQIAYMLEDADAEARVLLANQAKAVVAMNAAAQSAKAPTHFFKLPLTIFDGKKGEMLRIVVDGDGRTVPLENVLASINLGAVDAGNPAARTEAAPRIRRCTAPASSGVFVTDSSGKMTYTCYTCGASGDGASLVDCRYGPSNTPEER